MTSFCSGSKRDSSRRDRKTVRASGRGRGVLAGIVALLLLPGFAGCAPKETSYVVIRGERISVEIADTAAERRAGLMFREELGEDQGMLFVFPGEQILSFWMKNTQIPLSIAYLDADGVILGIHDMEPFSTESISSRVPALYALEVNQGTFERLGAVPGDRVVLPEELSGRESR